jgi:hypothetical protein
MQHDLTGETAPLYLAEAELYHLEKVGAAALPLCAGALAMPIEDASQCAAVRAVAKLDWVLALPPPLFQRVVLAPERTCTSEVLSRLVARYCRGPHADSIDGHFLASVSTAALLPSVDASEALALLELSVSHAPDDEGALQSRCIEACAAHWRQALVPALPSETAPAAAAADPARAGKRRRGAAGCAVEPPSPLGSTIPDSAKVHLLAAALKRANVDLNAELDAAVERERLLHVANRQNKTADALLSSQSSRISELEGQLRRFKRIPATETSGVQGTFGIYRGPSVFGGFGGGHVQPPQTLPDKDIGLSEEGGVYTRTMPSWPALVGPSHAAYFFE